MKNYLNTWVPIKMSEYPLFQDERIEVQIFSNPSGDTTVPLACQDFLSSSGSNKDTVKKLLVPNIKHAEALLSDTVINYIIKNIKSELSHLETGEN